ncbi:MAG: hypothetical protein ACOYXC_15220 [Candidatus Rifleibacteriota bacterium]
MNQSSEKRKVLISPLGASKGLLFSALNILKPSLVIVLTSHEFAKAAEEVFELTGQKNKVILIMKDVYTGFSETENLISEASEFFLNSDSIIINLTGGTTAMQWIMQAIYENLKNKKHFVRRVAFIDRRDAVEQRKSPYVIGEIFEIDKIGKPA